MADSSQFKFYHYAPSYPAAIVFAVLFALLACAQLYRVVRLRLWYFLIFSVGVIMEMLGYIGRAINANQYPDVQLGPYIMQSLCLLLPPTLFAATIYMTLGRVVRNLRAEACSPISTRFLTPIFVAGDVLVFLMQAAGAGLMSTGTGGGSFETGEHLVLAGICFQMVWFLVFMTVAGIFNWRLVAMQKTGLHTIPAGTPWRRDLAVLYSVSILITVRNVFRAVEYAAGYDGYLMTHEAFIYAFDGLLMAIAVALYAAFPPAQLSKSAAPYGLFDGSNDAQSSDLEAIRHVDKK